MQMYLNSYMSTRVYREANVRLRDAGRNKLPGTNEHFRREIRELPVLFFCEEGFSYPPRTNDHRAVNPRLFLSLSP